MGSGDKNKSKVQYRVLLKKRDGGLAEFTPYRVKKITRDAVSIDLDKARSLFPAVAGRLESPDGPVPMLVGMDHMKDAPREHSRKEGVVLYQSEFSTGHVVCGDMGGMVVEKEAEKSDSRVLSCRSTQFKPPEFIPAEAMGAELTPRCPACKNCKECCFQMDSLSFKENTEYEIILSKLNLDMNWKKWVAGYSFNMLVEQLIDNYAQARGYMDRMEARLVKEDPVEVRKRGDRAHHLYHHNG